MRNTEKYAGKRVLVVGMARSGIAAAQLLCKAGAHVIINDSKTAEKLGDSLKPLENLPLERRLGCPAMECLDGIDAMVISPVVPDNAPFVLKAKEMGVYVTGELEMAYQLSSGEMVAITGTNGKTTTVTLLGEIFRNAGRTTHVVGNIGYPYSAAGLDSQDDDLFVCEVSSFQMETAETFHPKAVGNNKCQAHIQCDSIIMDHAEIGSIPEIRARDLNAAIIHEAAIGRINDEQLLKLRTLGLTEEEAENVIIENFLN